MKRLILSLFVSILTLSVVFAQAPELFSYQSVIRNSANSIVANSNVGLRLSILQGTSGGTPVYVETHSATSNTNGLVSVEIGGGVIVSGIFAAIDWENGPFYLRTETDISGGTNYTISGIIQLISVPYALYAKRAQNGLPPGGTEGQVLTIVGGVPTWTGGNPVFPPGTVHCLGTSMSIVDVINPSTGATWMDRNLGASQVAQSESDVNAYGDVYQWGRGPDGHQCRTSPSTTISSSTDQPGHGNFIVTSQDWRVPANNSLWQGVNGINNPCPSGYRLPTESELNAERLSWPSNNSAGAFASPLNFTLSGIRSGTDGIISQEGAFGHYYTSTIDGLNVRVVRVDPTNAFFFSIVRVYGRSVRCIKN